jgi:tetratricopeptide (TPR) repeat protein
LHPALWRFPARAAARVLVAYRARPAAHGIQRMSFQGDVAGIGLSEVLQSLSRSEREGVLMLEAPGLAVRLGMRDSQIFLLPAPAEDADELVRRVQCAWIEDLPLAVRERRVQEVARAQRMEALYVMLDAPQMHFRFSPGPIVGLLGIAAGADGVAPDLNALFGPGYTAEFVLLEHARLLDESQGKQDLDAWAIPLLQVEVGEESRRNWLAQCNGSVTLAELADRMGWALRQARAAVRESIARGELALPDADAQLECALAELRNYRTHRAAARLTGWTRSRAGGPLDPNTVAALQQEWQAGRFAAALRAMPAQSARALLRAFDRSISDPHGSLERWESIREQFRTDPACALRCMAWRCTHGGALGDGAIGELLRVAAFFRDRGQLMRARTALRLAATQQPSQTAARLELGLLLCDAGLSGEGGAWVVSGAQEFLDAAEYERALAALRALLRADPENKDAQSLLFQTSALDRRRRRRRMQGTVALAVFLLAAAVAVVDLRRRSSLEQELGRISALTGDPKTTLAELERCFPGDTRSEVGALRAALQRRFVESEKARRTEWLGVYESVRAECQNGDPEVGLDRAITLPAPPKLEVEVPEWPTRAGLLSVLARRVEERTESARNSVGTSGAGTSSVTILAEERELALLRALLARCEREAEPTDLADFRAHLERVRASASAARAKRAEAQRIAADEEALREHDRMLESARAQARALDLEAALAIYAKLITAVAPASLPPLELERDGVKRHQEAVLQAQSLAAAGRHSEARAALEHGCRDTREHALPWRVVTDPPGARAHFADGCSRVTPFVLHSAFGERVVFDLEAGGCAPRHCEYRDPADVSLVLYRAPERAWNTHGSVEALPVSVGEDHVFANRLGELEKHGKAGRRWEHRLPTLGGVARTPMFLPQRPGWLLVLCEDGRCFLVEAATGHVEGPEELGAPPAEGTLATRGTLIAKLVDGRLAQWTDSVKPLLHPVDRPYIEPPTQADIERSAGSFAVLRRSASPDVELESPWTKWRVEVQGDRFHFQAPGGATRHGSAERVGQWNYVAWEAPNATIPLGRLWISDQRGLRSFQP